MTILDATPEERASGSWKTGRVDAAVQALREDGFVLLKDVVDPEHLAGLRERLLEDLQTLLARPDAPFNFNTGNIQQDPPPFPPYLFRDVLVNDLVIEVTRAVLGPGLKNAFYSGNTALPGGTRQPVHPDTAQLWPGLEHAPPAYGLVVNVPVVDVTPENGATELWPGTHRDTTYSWHDSAARVAEDLLERRRAECPPIQPSIPLGAVLVRDIRMWHAGMPNHTETPRPMIAMIHWCGWFAVEDRLQFAAGSEPFFEHPDLKTHAEFTAEPIDYLHRHGAYDLQR